MIQCSPRILRTLFLVSTLAQAAVTPDPQKIMARALNQDEGQDFKAQTKMYLVEKDGSQRERLFMLWRKKEGEDVKTLIKFATPEALKNTGLLTHSFKQKDDLVWLFLSKAAKKEPRKIASNQKSQSFLGSEFNYADFENRSVNDFGHVYLKTENLGVFDCDVVESTLKDSNDVYSKIVTWVDKKSSFGVRVDLYVKNELVKRFLVTDLKNVQGKWTVVKSEMWNLKNSKKTKLELNSPQYNSALNPALFTLQKLTDNL